MRTSLLEKLRINCETNQSQTEEIPQREAVKTRRVIRDAHKCSITGQTQAFGPADGDDYMLQSRFFFIHRGGKSVNIQPSKEVRRSSSRISEATVSSELGVSNPIMSCQVNSLSGRRVGKIEMQTTPI